jgi:hypothetical protein
LLTDHALLTNRTWHFQQQQSSANNTENMTMVKNAVILAVVVAAVLSATLSQAFAIVTPSSSRTSTQLFGYVPDGFTAESYKKFKEDEKKRLAPKGNLGGVGPRGFKSRSMQSFQEAMERGEAEHLLPVFNAKDKVKRGEIRVEDIPYMQRGGSWDNSDVKGAKNRKTWLASDKQYASGGFKKEQSVSIFGKGEGTGLISGL